MSILYGFPNQAIKEIGSLLMNDTIFNRFVYYDSIDDEDILSLPLIDNPVSELENKKVFYSRKVDRILHDAGMFVYIVLKSYKPETQNYKKSFYISDTTIEIGVVCHNKYRDTLNGSREVAVACRVAELVCENEELSGIGRFELVGFEPNYNIPPEYTAYRILVSVNNFSGLNVRK